MGKQKPVVFSTPMVRAILDGMKTQTRRIIKPQPQLVKTEVINGKPVTVMIDDGTRKAVRPYAVGDILWVRETWSDCDDFYYYKADVAYNPLDDVKNYKWMPSIFMPREAARLFLEVTDMGVEHLRNITPEDKKREGFSDCHRAYPCAESNQCDLSCFMKTWDRLYAKRGYGWDANPMVWVIEFKRVEGSAR